MSFNNKESTMNNGDSSSANKSEASDLEDYGFAAFPRRISGDKKEESRRFFLTNDFGSYISQFRHKKCLKSVISCINKDPMVKLLVGALKSKGCEVDLTRHISCEECYGPAGGGYDSIRKQVVLCEGKQISTKSVCTAMRHELIHAFDDCRSNMTITNMEHVACSEIRAANLTSCFYLGSWIYSLIPAFQISKAHRLCVKEKALTTLMSIRNVDREEGMEVVDRVFERCYNDLEPIGIRPKKKTYLNDARRALREARFYGYRHGEPLDEYDM